MYREKKLKHKRVSQLSCQKWPVYRLSIYFTPPFPKMEGHYLETKAMYSGLQKYSYPLKCSTFCHVTTTSVHLFYLDFMWCTNTKWCIVNKAWKIGGSTKHWLRGLNTFARHTFQFFIYKKKLKPRFIFIPLHNVAPLCVGVSHTIPIK